MLSFPMWLSTICLPPHSFPKKRGSTVNLSELFLVRYPNSKLLVYFLCLQQDLYLSVDIKRNFLTAEPALDVEARETSANSEAPLSDCLSYWYRCWLLTDVLISYRIYWKARCWMCRFSWILISSSCSWVISAVSTIHTISHPKKCDNEVQASLNDTQEIHPLLEQDL